MVQKRSYGSTYNKFHHEKNDRKFSPSKLRQKLTNHSARKTLVKNLRQNYIPKPEIIGITSHSSEAGHDVYDSEWERGTARHI